MTDILGNSNSRENFNDNYDKVGWRDRAIDYYDAYII